MKHRRLAEAVLRLRPGAQFSVTGDDSAKLVFHDGNAAPSDAEIAAEIAAIEAEKAGRLYRDRRKAAYAAQLGKDPGDIINTLGDVLDVLIAQVEAMRQAAGAAATADYAAMLAKIAAIKAAYPKA